MRRTPGGENRKGPGIKFPEVLPGQLTSDREHRTWFGREKWPTCMVHLRLLLTPSFAPGIGE